MLYDDACSVAPTCTILYVIWLCDTWIILTGDVMKIYDWYVSTICYESDDCCIYAHSITELCHEMLMELECIFILSNMPCKVSYETSCMFVCHLHWDTSSLCHERMKFDIYVIHDIMRDFSVLWCLVTYNTLCPTKPGLGVRIRAHLVGSCARTWASCGEIPHIQPYPE